MSRPTFTRYKQFHDIFSSNLSYQEIADQLGVSRQRVHQIYQRYFRGEFPHREGYSRVIRITRERRRKELAYRLLATRPLMDLYIECASRGIILEPRYQLHPATIRPLRLLANGKTVDLHVTKHAYIFKTRSKFYTHVIFSTKQLRVCDFVLILDTAFGQPRYFIIPSKDLLSSIHKRRKRTRSNHIDIYIPAKQHNNPHPGKKSVLNIFQYQNRWDFLIPHPPYGFPREREAATPTSGVLEHCEV